MSDRDQGLFRAAAIEARARRSKDGDILRIDARWPRVIYWLVVAAAGVALLFVMLVPVSEYATGPAVVRFDGRRVIPATAAGTVDELSVQPGQRVAAGEALVRLHSEEETAELARATSEFDLQLARLLRDPADVIAKQTLAALRSKRDQAKNTLAERTLRAPIAGVVSEIHTHAGQKLAEGDVALTIAPDAGTVSVLAVVAGDYRPMLERGQEVRFSLDGFKFDYHTLELEKVSDEAIGPTEVRRYFGPELADALALEPGAKALVRARVPTTSFTFEGRPYGYFDGLTGIAEVRVRREPILVMLIPALRTVWK
jgi:membrane fusion protein (multidrug efflux system)